MKTFYKHSFHAIDILGTNLQSEKDVPTFNDLEGHIYLFFKWMC